MTSLTVPMPEHLHVGSGLEYAQTRDPTVAGDPIQQMDWKVTRRAPANLSSRNTKPSNVSPVQIILVDTSGSMVYIFDSTCPSIIWQSGWRPLSVPSPSVG